MKRRAAQPLNEADQPPRRRSRVHLIRRVIAGWLAAYLDRWAAPLASQLHQGTGLELQSLSLCLVLAAGCNASSLANTAQKVESVAPTVPVTTVAANRILPPALHCFVNETVSDPEGDVLLPHIDVVEMHSELENEMAKITLALTDLPSELTFNRIADPNSEYIWSVLIDVDNNPNTGDWRNIGAEYDLLATHMPPSGSSPLVGEIEDNVRVNLWKYDSNSKGYSAASGNETLSIDTESNIMTFTARIPGINSTSRLSFLTYDRNPEGAPQTDTSLCANRQCMLNHQNHDRTANASCLFVGVATASLGCTNDGYFFKNG